jgi:hypothetical protein
MGAACVIWLRQDDRCGLRVLENWVLLRARLMVASVRRRHWLGVWEEALVLSGTARGILWGIRARRSP